MGMVKFSWPEALGAIAISLPLMVMGVVLFRAVWRFSGVPAPGVLITALVAVASVVSIPLFGMDVFILRSAVVYFGALQWGPFPGLVSGVVVSTVPVLVGVTELEFVVFLIAGIEGWVVGWLAGKFSPRGGTLGRGGLIAILACLAGAVSTLGVGYVAGVQWGFDIVEITVLALLIQVAAGVVLAVPAWLAVATHFPGRERVQ